MRKSRDYSYLHRREKVVLVICLSYFYFIYFKLLMSYGKLSWLLVGFWAHVKCCASYRMHMYVYGKTGQTNWRYLNCLWNALCSRRATVDRQSDTVKLTNCCLNRRTNNECYSLIPSFLHRSCSVWRRLQQQSWCFRSRDWCCVRTISRASTSICPPLCRTNTVLNLYLSSVKRKSDENEYVFDVFPHESITTRSYLYEAGRFIDCIASVCQSICPPVCLMSALNSEMKSSKSPKSTRRWPISLGTRGDIR